MNEGLPSDPEERARVMRTPLEVANSYWKRVGRSFVKSEVFLGKVVNPRQEIERQRALSKSASTRKAANVRHHPETQKQLPLAQEKPPIDPAPADEQMQEVCDAFDRHQCFRNGEPKDLIVQNILSMNGKFDWGRFRQNHNSYCDYWADKGWNFCRLTFNGWIEAGMPGNPEDSKGKYKQDKTTGCPVCKIVPCVCFERHLAKERERDKNAKRYA